MSPAAITLVVIIVIVVVLIIWLITANNSLVKLRNMVDNSWSQIDVQLKQRADLIPNLVETVKGYATHESQTFEQVTQARAAAAGAHTMQERADAEDQISRGILNILATAEAYPQLQANQNFLQLQGELQTLENKIAYARQFFNDTVLKFNNKVQMFPSNIVASMFHFSAREFFKASPQDTEVPKVSFSAPPTTPAA